MGVYELFRLCICIPGILSSLAPVDPACKDTAPFTVWPARDHVTSWKVERYDCHLASDKLYHFHPRPLLYMPSISATPTQAGHRMTS